MQKHSMRLSDGRCLSEDRLLGDTMEEERHYRQGTCIVKIVITE